MSHSNYFFVCDADFVERREREVCANEIDLTCRAFADFVLGSLILHFFCVNFIN